MEPPGGGPHWGQIAAELSEPLLRYLWRRVGDPADAEDLLQESLIRIGRGLPAYTGRASLKTWAFSIASRVVADHYRDPINGVRLVELQEAEELCAAACSVEQQVVEDEMNAWVRRNVDALPKDSRIAVVLHDLEGLTAAQTAEVCGCSLSAAKIRIHRARRRLRRALASEYGLYRDTSTVLPHDKGGLSGLARHGHETTWLGACHVRVRGSRSEDQEHCRDHE